MLRTTVLVFAIFFGSVLHASERLALVIGNDNYNEVASLELARADAKSYAELLSERGFQVTQLEDVDARTMRRSLALFYDKISPGDTVAFVFAGHGWSDGRENYLIPTDAQLSSSPTVIAAESFSLSNGANGIVDEIKRRRPRFLFAVIDACRNNPFRSGNRTRSIGMERGLSVISAPTGTFIAFSAGAGQTALDRLSDNDQAQNSVFTRYFIRELRLKPDIQTAFKATQIAVVNSATKIGHPQRPAYYDEVVGRACLEGACISRPQQAVETNFDATKRADILFWDSINESKDPADFNEYLKRFPDGTFSGVARRRLASLASDEVSLSSVQADAEPRILLPEWCVEPVEEAKRLICNTKEFITSEARVKRLYRARLAHLKGGDAYGKVILLHASFMEARTACGANPQCLTELYRTHSLALMGLPPGLSPDQQVVFQVQAELKRLSCGGGAPDGLNGVETRSALRLASNNSRGSLPKEARAHSIDTLARLRKLPDGLCSLMSLAVAKPTALNGTWRLTTDCPEGSEWAEGISTTIVTVRHEVNDTYTANFGNLPFAAAAKFDGKLSGEPRLSFAWTKPGTNWRVTYIFGPSDEPESFLGNSTYRCQEKLSR